MILSIASTHALGIVFLLSSLFSSSLIKANKFLIDAVSPYLAEKRPIERGVAKTLRQSSILAKSNGLSSFILKLFKDRFFPHGQMDYEPFFSLPR